MPLTSFDARLAAVPGDVPFVVWPPIVTGRRAQLLSLLHQLDRSQWVEAEDVAAHQRRSLLPAGALVEGALVLRDHLWRDIDFAGRRAVVSGDAVVPTETATWGRPFDLLFATGPQVQVAADDALTRFGPTVVSAPPSSLPAVLDRCPSARWIRSTAPDVPDELRAEARRRGVTLWATYEPGDVGVVASECPSEAGVLHVHAEAFVVEVDAGRIVVTVTGEDGRRGRHETDDVGELGPPCPCGRGLPTLRRVVTGAAR